MNAAELLFSPVEVIGPLLRKKKLSPLELVDALLARIERENPLLTAYITVTAEQARAQARRAEREILHGRYRGPLHGIPISLKDNIWTRGVLTTAGSKILAGFLPPEDATIARRLAHAGAILLGKTNMHEFAYGATTENPHFGATRNPWNTARIAGGSSGGSAAAIAAGLCFGSIGTDTGGSIRIPSALCGIAGLKPTYGRVSCHGVIPLSRSLDHVGPLAQTVTDLAIILEIIAGRDPLDPTTACKPVAPYLRALGGKLKPLRLGWPREYYLERVDTEIRQAVEDAARKFERLGAKMEEISLPRLAESGPAGDHIALAEARQYHDQMGYFPARAAEYGPDVRVRLEAGSKVTALDYLRAFDMRRSVIEDFQSVFRRVDAIVAPTVPMPATPIGVNLVDIGAERESVRSALIRPNRPANLAGLPAISIPCGFTKDGLPIGLQLIGAAWSEARLLRIALAYERATTWHNCRPRG